MALTFPALNLLAPVVLALHNLDEYRRFDDFIDAYQPRVPAALRTRAVVLIATTLLTVTVAVVAVLTWRLPGLILLALSRAIVFALAFNALGHCVLSLYRRRVLPGTPSAVTLVLPFSAAAITLMGTSLRDTGSALVAFAGLGIVLTPVSIVLFQGAGFGLSRVLRLGAR